MPVLISMLRGVNVGGHNKIKMDALRALYKSLKLESPRTYVQSGNIIFRTKEKNSAVLAKKIQSTIERKFGFRPEVILRTTDEMRAAIAASPFAGRNLEPGKTRIFQIWIMPRQKGGSPAWGSQPFPKADRSGRFVTLASGFAEDTDALPIRADARVLGATLKAGETAIYPLGKARHGYLVPASGAIEIDGVRIDARDGAAITDAEVVTVKALADSELVLVDTQ